MIMKVTFNDSIKSRSKHYQQHSLKILTYNTHLEGHEIILVLLVFSEPTLSPCGLCIHSILDLVSFKISYIRLFPKIFPFCKNYNRFFFIRILEIIVFIMSVFESSFEIFL